MKCSKEIRQELFRVGRMSARVGQSMTSLLVGIAIMGCVGAGAATISRSTSIQEMELSAKSGAGLLMESLADEIRKNTRYSEIATQYDGKTFGESSVDDEFIARTTVRKTCNASPSTNCDATHVDIEIVDKNTGETVLKQSVTRAYTHYEEFRAFSTLGSFAVPEDAIAVRYTSDGGRGNSGGSRTSHGYNLKINSAACGWDYKPNNASPRPNGCVACPAPSGTKQYRSGDCTIGTCPTGQKANSAQNGCEAITCPSGYILNGDTCEPSCRHPTYYLNVVGTYSVPSPSCCAKVDAYYRAECRDTPGIYWENGRCEWGARGWHCGCFCENIVETGSGYYCASWDCHLAD